MRTRGTTTQIRVGAVEDHTDAESTSFPHRCARGACVVQGDRQSQSDDTGAISTLTEYMQHLLSEGRRRREWALHASVSFCKPIGKLRCMSGRNKVWNKRDTKQSWFEDNGMLSDEYTGDSHKTIVIGEKVKPGSTSQIRRHSYTS